jgi:hypothetical protein
MYLQYRQRSLTLPALLAEMVLNVVFSFGRKEVSPSSLYTGGSFSQTKPYHLNYW